MKSLLQHLQWHTGTKYHYIVSPGNVYIVKEVISEDQDTVYCEIDTGPEKTTYRFSVPKSAVKVIT